MNKTEDISAVILLGGFSRRLGMDKSTINLHGVEQYNYLNNLLSTIFSSVFFSGRSEQKSKLNLSENFIQDIYIDQGPLIGILSSLKHVKTSVLFIACDMPFINLKTITHLIHCQSKHHDIILFKDTQSKRLQPLVSIWDQSMIKPIEEYILSGQRSVIDFIQSQNHLIIESDEPNVFFNINSPEDLIYAEKLINIP